MTDLIPFKFHDDELLLVEFNGKPHVAFRPVVFALGLDYSAALQRLKRQHWATTVVTTIPDGDRPSHQVVAIDVKTLLMFLATVQTSRVAEHVRPKLVAYQSEVAEAIEAYWTKGHALSDRAIDEPITYTWDEVSTIIRQRYGVNVAVPVLTRMLRAAGVLRQSGAPKKAHQHFFWFTGTAWEIHAHAVPFLTRTFEETARQLQEFRFIQARLEFEGLTPALPPRSP